MMRWEACPQRSSASRSWRHGGLLLNCLLDREAYDNSSAIAKAMQYKGFISYSHAADGRLAPALQSALHRFAKPWYRLRAIRVFRDKTSLSANPSLWPAIEKALSESEWFLLMASPQAAESVWVGDEIDWWLKNRSGQKLLTLLTDGEIVWDRASNDFDWSRTTGLSQELRGRITENPLYVDFRWAKNAENLTLRHSQFRSAVLDIAAPLHGKPKDELDGEDVRQHRRIRRIAGAAVALIALFAIAAGWAAYLASINAATARAQQQLAENNSREAHRQQVIAQENARETRRQQTIAQTNAETASRQRDLAELREKDAAEQRKRAEQATMESNRQRDEAVKQRELAELRGRIALGRQLAIQARERLSGRDVHEQQLALLLALVATKITPSAETRGSLLAALRRGNLMKDDVFDGYIEHKGPVTDVAFAANGKIIASASMDKTVLLWDVKKVHVDKVLNGHQASVTTLAVSPDGATLASGGADAAIILWNLATGEARSRLAGHGSHVTSIAFNPDGRLLASGGADKKLMVWDVEGAKVDKVLTDHGPAVSSIAFSPDGKMLAALNADKTIVLWDVAQGNQRSKLTHHDMEEAGRIAFSPDGRMIASGGINGLVLLWDVPTGRLVGEMRGHTSVLASVAFSPDGKSLASGSWDGTAILWDVATSSPIVVFKGDGSNISSVAFSPDGKTLATGNWRKAVTLWNADIQSWGEEACTLARRNLTHWEWDNYVGREWPYQRVCTNSSVPVE